MIIETRLFAKKNLSFTNTNFFLGNNGSGKSTLLREIQKELHFPIYNSPIDKNELIATFETIKKDNSPTLINLLVSMSLSFQDKTYFGSDFINNASDGIIKILSNIHVAYYENIFAIDNFDSGIHPLIAKKLIILISEFINEQNKTGFFVINNPITLDGILNNSSVFTLDIDNKKQSHIHKIDLYLCSKYNLPLSEIWVSNFCGGTPNI